MVFYLVFLLTRLKLVVKKLFININYKVIELRKKNLMVEPLLSGIVLGLVPVTIGGLFVTAYLQYKRGDRVV